MTCKCKLYMLCLHDTYKAHVSLQGQMYESDFVCTLIVCSHCERKKK